MTLLEAILRLVLSYLKSEPIVVIYDAANSVFVCAPGRKKEDSPGEDSPETPEPSAPPEPERPGEGKEANAYVIGCTLEEKTMLARMIQAEAEAEPYEGQVAVGAVIVNRVKDPRFASTIEGVLYDPGQFEPMFNGRFHAITTPNESCLAAAEAALLGEDPTGGALFFYNPDKATNTWIRSRQVVKKIGNHVFAL